MRRSIDPSPITHHASSIRPSSRPAHRDDHPSTRDDVCSIGALAIGTNDGVRAHVCDDDDDGDRGARVFHRYVAIDRCLDDEGDDRALYFIHTNPSIHSSVRATMGERPTDGKTSCRWWWWTTTSAMTMTDRLVSRVSSRAIETRRRVIRRYPSDDASSLIHLSSAIRMGPHDDEPTDRTRDERESD